MSNAPDPTPTTAERVAEALARRLHARQVDKGGRPYVDHLAAVVGILRRRWPDAPASAIEASWLHDVLEDTDAIADDFLAEGVSAEAVNLIRALTRRDGKSYRQWIADLAASGDLWAIRIKLADNEHNSDPSRRLPNSNIIEKRYVPARQVLERALTEIEAA